ncbi:MAG: cell filamentation protein Fic [Gemmatimonadaceae bacterium 4484_173]|nr:MAG: cell filamentation protein Fic [Gemmatimonadaceae bacterium 4484_173]RKZ05145.1 MAG: cell filamentation protein Fic [Candidatus Fermentibacteria bacterium]
MEDNPLYSPPFEITAKTERLIGEVCEFVGRLSSSPDAERHLRLRRASLIRTVHGSLAIEGNTLTERQITAVIEGKRVIAPPREIREVRNAFTAYEKLNQWNSRSETDFLAAHRAVMSGLLDFPGKYRTGNVGVMGAREVVHVAPPADRVPFLTGELFRWLNRSDHHPVVESSVFHYELEFIHPFEDGNGRMGRLWQTLILTEWNPVFSFLPVESIVHSRQQKYYDALADSTTAANCSPFVEFMLAAILEAAKEFDYSTGQVTGQVKKLLECLGNNPVSRREIMDRLDLKGRDNFEKLYLHPALDAGLIEMTHPEKPNSRLQKYRITSAGRRLAAESQ